MKKYITIILLFIIIFIVYYSNSHFITKKNFTTHDYKTHNYETYNYEISTNTNLKNIYLITLEKNDFVLKKYLVKDNETLEITVPQNKDFIISLYANVTIDAKWNLQYDSKILKFEKMNWLEPDVNNNDDSTGNSMARQYFYFNPKNEGNEVITFVYKHNKENKQDFKFSIKIKILSDNNKSKSP